MAKDYIIFDSAPILRFTTTDPFTSEGDFSSVSKWYEAQSRNTKKPRPKIFGSISTENCDTEYSVSNISAALNVHGNYTAYYRKKSFKLKLDTAVNLFGLNKGYPAKNWILLADYGDNSMLRNALALYMGKQFLRTQWAASFTFVHVYIDQEYWGLYLLADSKEVSESRININKPEENYTGVDIGYFVERDDYWVYDNKDPGFVINYFTEYLPQPLPVVSHETNTSYGVDATYRDEYSIVSDIYSDDQVAFIKKFLMLTYNILYEACVNNHYYEINSNNISDWQNWTLVESELTDPLEVVSKVIDVQSFIDMYLLQEFAGNPDLAHSSFYMCVDMSATGNKKLGLCCPWDFDRAFGISNGLASAGISSLWAKNAHYNPWISLLPQAEWFRDMLATRHRGFVNKGIYQKCCDMLEDYAITYAFDFIQNYTKYSITWEGDLDGWVNNGSPAKIASLRPTYYQNITSEYQAETILKDWVSNRALALSNAFDPQPGPTPPSPEELAAPIITFNYEGAIHDWYENSVEGSEFTRINGTLTTSNCEDKYKIQDLETEIRVRGNYTANYSKKPFQIKFSSKQNLFGLNNGKKFKKWILLAEYNDSSMTRNALAFYMARRLFNTANGAVWVPDFTYAHLYIQDSERLYYMGLYLVVDQKEQNKNRVDVAEPEPGYEGTDIGYYFERDDYYATSDDPTFFIYDDRWFGGEYRPKGPTKTNHESNRWARQAQGSTLGGDGYTIKSTINCQEQIDYLKARVLKIYELMYRAVFNEEYYELDVENNLIPTTLTDPYEILNKTIDIESFVATYILQEIVCNPDIAHSSFYLAMDMSVTGDKRLHLTCPWDFDLAEGIHYQFALDPRDAGLWAKQCTMNYWVSMLTNCGWFMDLVKEKWQEMYDDCFMRRCLNMLSETATKYQQDFAKNFVEWDIVWYRTGHKTWNLDGNTRPTNWVRTEYYDDNIHNEEELNLMTSSWIDRRFKELHQQFDGEGSTDWPEPPDPPVPPEPDPGKAGQIFRKDNLVKIYTEETWNQMYEDAAKNPDDLTKLWNMLYTSKSNAAVILYNKMYAAVQAGKKLSDPELQAELKAWNINALR